MSYHTARKGNGRKMDACACMRRPGHLDARAVAEGVARTNPQTLAPHACPRSRAWPAEPAHRWRFAFHRPVRCNSLAPLSQRLAGLLEEPSLLTPRARPNRVDVHRFGVRRVHLGVTQPSGTAVLSSCWASCCCCCCCPFATLELHEPLCAAPLPRIRRPLHALLHRRRARR